MIRWLHAWLTLTSRNLQVFGSDRVNLAVVIAQTPVIALFTLIAFHHFERDDEESNYFARIVYHFNACKASYEVAGQTVPLYDVIIPQAQEAARGDTEHLGVPAAQHRAAIYFVLVSAAIWIGLMGSCREIVGEQHLLLRESRSCISLGPYLCAKLAVQALLTALQIAVLTAVVAVALLHSGWRDGVVLWLVLWLTAFAAVALGLLISCLAPSIRAALTLVPILMLPQLLMGGLLRQPAAAGVGWGYRCCAAGTLQRWGFEAALLTDQHATRHVLSVRFDPGTMGRRYGELNLLQATEQGLHNLFFNEPAVSENALLHNKMASLLRCWVLLTLFLLTPLVLGMIILHRKYFRVG